MKIEVKLVGIATYMMAVVVTACWLSLAILTFFPASAIARLGPGTYPFAKTASNQEQTERISEFITNSNIQDLQTPQEVNTILSKNFQNESTSSRRELVGSSPPTCVGRCAACEPCKPVHVVISSPHPVISETDYYPEVWRCSCGNQLYMP